MMFVTSCATMHPDKFQPQQTSIDYQNYYLLNGRFSRHGLSKDSCKRNDEDLFWDLFRQGHHYMINDTNDCTVELLTLNPKQLKVTYLINDSVIDSRILNGRIKYGYFELRRSTLIIPAIIVNIFRTIKFRFGILENGNLTTDYREVAFGTAFLIIPVYYDEKREDLEFQKIGK